MLKKVILLFLTLIVLVGILSLGFWLNYRSFLNSRVPSKVIITIPSGMPKSSIADLLIKNSSLSKRQSFYVKAFYGLHKGIPVEAGSYVFKKGTKYIDLMSGFQDGSLLSKVTFLEGWRVEESSLYLAKKVSKEFAWKYYLSAKEHEGYLFPDTYYINKGTSAQTLVNLQLKTFDKKISSIGVTKTDLPPKDLVILASILEREANSDDDLPLIAGILIKRYREGMALDADATSQYATRILSDSEIKECIQNLCKLSFWPKLLTESDLKNSSSFNTRGKPGLPPTPISNPSLKALRAVYNPKPSPYYFYLHDKKGRVYFAVTLEKHIENIRNYL